MTHSAGRGPTSTYHTAMELVSDTSVDFDLEKLRSELERDLHTWSHPQQASADEVSAFTICFRVQLDSNTKLRKENEVLRLVCSGAGGGGGVAAVRDADDAAGAGAERAAATRAGTDAGVETEVSEIHGLSLRSQSTLLAFSVPCELFLFEFLT